MHPTPHDIASASASVQEPQAPEPPVWRYIGILTRRIWIILPVFVIVGTVGTVRAFKEPPLYRATAKVLVERQAPRVVQFGQTLPDSGGWDPEFYQTQAELLRSRAVMDVALSDPAIAEWFAPAQTAPATATPAAPAGRKTWRDEWKRTLRAVLGTAPAAMPEPWEQLRGQITVTVVENTHFLLVESVSANPYQAARVVNAAARGFQQYHKQRQSEAFSEAFAGLQKEREKEEQELLAAEKALQEYREQARGISASPDEKDQPVLDRLVRLNNRLTEVQLKRIELTAQIAAIKDAAQAGSERSEADQERLFALPVIQADATLTAHRRALADAVKDLTVLSETYGAGHPLLQAAQVKVELMREQLKRALNETLEAQSRALAALQQEEQDLAREYEGQKNEALDLARESFTLTRLRGAVDRHRRLFEAIVDRMREVDITSGLTKTNVQIVELAAEPKHPINSGKMRPVALSLVMGLLLGIGLAVLLENLDDAIRTPEDLRDRLGLPLLGFVPVIRHEPNAASADAARRLTLDVKESPDRNRHLYRGSIVLSEPGSSVAEAFRGIRTSLLYSSPGREIKCIETTSCRPEEGKTTTCTNLALCLAQGGKRVLLVDADMHRPMVHRILGLTNRVGLSSVLVGEAEWPAAIQRVVAANGAEVENLRVLSAGPPSPNPSELIGSKAARELIRMLRAEFDWVLLDTPPVLFASDAAVLSTLCDGVVLVVRAGMSSRAIVARAREQLEAVHARIVGAILNNAVIAKLGRHYSYYSYYGYSRYAKDYHRAYYGRDRDRRERETESSEEASKTL